MASTDVIRSDAKRRQPGWRLRGPGRPKAGPKRHLTAGELKRFKEMLLERRRRLVGDIGAMETAGEDGAPELLDSEWALLREIDDALERIANATYGICQATGAPIAKGRLRACPWARHCIEHARRNERARAPAVEPRRWPDEDIDESPDPDARELLGRE